MGRERVAAQRKLKGQAGLDGKEVWVPAGLGRGGLGRLGQIGERNRKMCLRILADVFWNLNQGDFGSKYFKGL
jgi:hypothetical protein